MLLLLMLCLMWLVVALGLMVMLHLGCLRLVQLVRMLKVLHGWLAKGAQRSVRLQAVMRRHRRMQATSFEVRFHSQHVFRRREQLAGFH